MRPAAATATATATGKAHAEAVNDTAAAAAAVFIEVVAVADAAAALASPAVASPKKSRLPPLSRSRRTRLHRVGALQEVREHGAVDARRERGLLRQPGARGLQRVRRAVHPMFGAEAVALAHKLFDKMHRQELLQKDMSADHVSMRSPRGEVWT